MIRSNCCIAAMELVTALPEVFLYWQPYLMVPSFLFLFPPKICWSYFAVTLSPPPPKKNLLVLLCCNNVWVSRAMRHLSFFVILFSGVFSKFLCDSMGNSYCKKDYSKGGVNVVKITQIRLQYKNEECSYSKFLLFG